MSWLKEKIMGAKPRVNSFSSGEESEVLGNSNALYCQTQLKNFIAKGQELKTYVIGCEHMSEVRTMLPRRNILFTKFRCLP